jgi:hypothetical protein
MPNYLAVIGDIIDSKKIKNREVVQNAMGLAFDKLRRDYQDLFVSKFTMTIGDEFQALLKPKAEVWKLLDHLMIYSPVSYRLGLGFGKIRTKINPEQSLGADGEAFWRAREAIIKVHVQNWNGRSHVLFKGSDEKQDGVINSLILSSEMMKSAWTKTQYTLFSSLINEGIYHVDFNQKHFSETIGISESSLSKRLTASNIKIYFQLRQTLGQLLEDYDDRA